MVQNSTLTFKNTDHLSEKATIILVSSYLKGGLAGKRMHFFVDYSISNQTKNKDCVLSA